MGFNNLRLVKLFFLVCILVLALILVILLTHKDNIENSYKPMVKINEAIYLWEDDLENIDLNKLEYMGEIEFSYKTLKKKLDHNDLNFSSNIYSKKTKIYKYDDTRVILILDKTASILRRNDDQRE